MYGEKRAPAGCGDDAAAPAYAGLKGHWPPMHTGQGPVLRVGRWALMAPGTFQALRVLS